jgi:hypothetical protein
VFVYYQPGVEGSGLAGTGTWWTHPTQLLNWVYISHPHKENPWTADSAVKVLSTPSPS